MRLAKFNFRHFLLLLMLAVFAACSNDDDEVPVVVEPEPELTVSPTSLQFAAEGGEEELEISSNTTWTASTDSDWISVSEGSSEGNSTITVTAAENEETETRSGIITFEAEGISSEVQVTQDAAEEVPDEVEATIPPDETNMRALTSIQLADDMGIGWNLGNSLEAIGGETAWGNPEVNKQLIDEVKAAGFNAVRIPVAWSKFSNEDDFIIREDWMNRVEEVVNYVLENDMYAIINIHWDNGWIIPTYAEEEYVNNRLEAMWQQIAIHFRDYDDRLLFAGTNEVMVAGDYGTPTEEYYTVQNGYNQTFVNTVRETGGRNHYRHLVVQGFNTNIDNTVRFAEIPTDVVEDRLMMEVHYYDPYNFTLNENSDVYQWGEDAPNSESWANESWVDQQFQRMKTNFVDEGVAVILGEYGAISRNVEGHEQYRQYYIEYVTNSALEHGLVPFYWDNGYAGNHGFALFNRSTGEIINEGLLESIFSAADQ